MKLGLAIAVGVALLMALAWYMVPIVRTGFLIGRVQLYERFTPAAFRRVHVLGDSTGYGTGASRARYTIAGRIGEAYPAVSITNDSVNGRTIAEATTALERTTFVEEPDVLLLQIGGNDILSQASSESVAGELTELLGLATEKASHVVLMACGNVGGATRFTGERAEYYQERSQSFDAMFSEVAAETGVTFVSLYQEPENDPFVYHPDIYLSLDGLHPSNKGYEYWFGELKPVLDSLLD